MLSGVLHQVMSGIATGGIYASVALALVMIYQATHHVNFAQGEMATFSTYIALTCINAGLPYWIALAVSVVFSFGVGVAIERILMRPLANAPILASVGVFVGLLLIINSLSGWFFDYTIKQFPTPFPDLPLVIGPFSVSWLRLFVLCAASVLIALSYYLINRTRLDLPAPDRPITPVIEPRAIAKSISRRASMLGLSRYAG